MIISVISVTSLSSKVLSCDSKTKVNERLTLFAPIFSLLNESKF